VGNFPQKQARISIKKAARENQEFETTWGKKGGRKKEGGVVKTP